MNYIWKLHPQLSLMLSNDKTAPILPQVSNMFSVLIWSVTSSSFFDFSTPTHTQSLYIFMYQPFSLCNYSWRVCILQLGPPLPFLLLLHLPPRFSLHVSSYSWQSCPWLWLPLPSFFNGGAASMTLSPVGRRTSLSSPEWLPPLLPVRHILPVLIASIFWVRTIRPRSPITETGISIMGLIWGLRLALVWIFVRLGWLDFKFRDSRFTGVDRSPLYVQIVVLLHVCWIWLWGIWICNHVVVLCLVRYGMGVFDYVRNVLS